MSESYVPDQDGPARDWMNNLAQKLVATPAAYGVAMADAVAVQAATQAYDAAYVVAVDPATRPPVNVNLKDQARNAAEAICRQ